MDSRKSYKRCSLDGKGNLNEINKKVSAEFDIVDISASGASIKTAADLSPGDEIQVEMQFAAHIVEKVIKVKARVARKEERQTEFLYGIKFAELTSKELVEIDEIINYGCTTSDINRGIDSCESGNCTLLKQTKREGL